MCGEGGGERKEDSCKLSHEDLGERSYIQTEAAESIVHDAAKLDVGQVDMSVPNSGC